MIIIRANSADLQAIINLQHLAYQSEATLLNNFDIQPLKQTIDEINIEHRKGIILKTLNDSNAIVGSVRAKSDHHTTYIGKLIVHPKWQNQGLGTQLLLAIEKQYKNNRCELFTSAQSQNNLRLYEKCGYKRFKELNDNGLPLVYLEKTIN